MTFMFKRFEYLRHIQNVQTYNKDMKIKRIGITKEVKSCFYLAL